MQTYLTRSGLVVAEQAVDELGLQRDLEHLDPRLVLTREVDRRHGCFVWHVHVVWATDRPAAHVLRWEDPTGRPLPLSSGLLERVRELLNRVDREGTQTADTANARRAAAIDKQIDEASSEAARLVARFGAAGHSAVFHRGQGLRRARARGKRR